MKLPVVAVLLFSAASLAATDVRVQRGVELFDKGDFAQSKDALVTVVESPSLSSDERAQARSYLAAAYQALGDVASAKAQLLVLARERPDFRLDPGTFLPELIALADDARTEVAQEPRPPEPVSPKPLPKDALATTQTGSQTDARPSPPTLTQAPAAPPAAITAQPLPPTADARPPLGLMFIPFGVGQFTLDQNVKGTLFLSGEVLALGTSGVTLAMFESQKTSGTFLGGGTFRNPQQAATLQTIYLVSAYTGVALMVGGVIDAIVSRAELGDGASLASTGTIPAKRLTFTGQGLLIRF